MPKKKEFLQKTSIEYDATLDEFIELLNEIYATLSRKWGNIVQTLSGQS